MTEPTVEQQAHVRKRREALVNARRRKREALANLRGSSVGLVEAAPVRRRLNELTALGWSYEAINHLVGAPGTAAGLRLIGNGTHRQCEQKFAPIAALPVTLYVPPRVLDTCLVPGLGAFRRVRALQAIGWRHTDVSELIGRASHHLVTGRHPRMAAFDWHLVDAAYEKLSGTPGGSATTATRAAAKGWAPPLAWDDIDDPTEQPKGMAADDPEPKEVADSARIERFFGGDYTSPATRADRIEIVARWRTAGRSLAELRRLTGWKPERYYDTTEESAA